MKNITSKTWMAFGLATAVTASLALVGTAGPGGNYSAQSERSQRESAVIQAREAYWQGVDYEKNGELEEAGGYYRLALDTVPNAERTAGERDSYADAFANICIQLADQRAREGSLEVAKSYIDVALQYAPADAGALEMKERLNDAEWYAPGNDRVHQAKVTRVTQGLGQANAALQIGEIDASEKSYIEVLQADPYNKAARKGLSAVERQRSRYLDSAYDETRISLLDDLMSKWELPIPRKKRLGNLPEGDSISSSSDTREDIQRRLDNIIVPEINLGPIDIRGAKSYLMLTSKELDPEGVGVSIQIDEQAINAADGNALNQQFSINLLSTPLGEVLRYVTEFAGLRYTVERYAVKIIPGEGTGLEQIIRKEFRVPPSFDKLGTEGGDDGTGGDPFAIAAETTASARSSAEDILKSRGVPWPEGATALYNRGSSTLIVSNTKTNMELVDAFVESIQEEIVKQVEIRVKFLEVRQENLDELGFDWLVGAFGLGGGDRILGGGGTPGNSRGVFDTGQFPFFDLGQDADGNPVTAATGFNPVTGGLRTGDAAIQGSAIDSLIADVPRGQAEALLPAPGIVSLAGIFTDPQFQVVMRGLSQHKSIDLVTAPTVVTKSAQRAKVEVIRELIYPVEFDPPELPQEVGAVQGGVFPVTPSHPTTFEMRPTGVTLEVDPQVGPDSYTIDLNLAPEIVEFDGFVNYGSPITAAGTDALGSPIQIVVTENRIDLPIFSTRRAATNVTVYDGATVALGGLIREDVQETHDKVPIMGDLPYIGRLFRSTAEQHLRRNLVIFVTARLIDPSGQSFRKQLESSLESAPGLE